MLEPSRRHDFIEIKIFLIFKILVRSGCRAPENDPSAAMVLDIDSDIGMRIHKINLSPRDLLLQGISASAALDNLRPPVRRIIAVGKESCTEAILIVLAITIVIDALAVEFVICPG